MEEFMKYQKKHFALFLALALFSFNLLFAETQSLKLLTNAHCNGCKTKIEKALKKVDGVQSASLDLASKIVEVSFDPSKVDSEKLTKAIEKAGYSAALYKEGETITLPEHKDSDHKDKKSEKCCMDHKTKKGKKCN